MLVQVLDLWLPATAMARLADQHPGRRGWLCFDPRSRPIAECGNAECKLAGEINPAMNELSYRATFSFYTSVTFDSVNPIKNC